MYIYIHKHTCSNYPLFQHTPFTHALSLFKVALSLRSLPRSFLRTLPCSLSRFLPLALCCKRSLSHVHALSTLSHVHALSRSLSLLSLSSLPCFPLPLFAGSLASSPALSFFCCFLRLLCLALSQVEWPYQHIQDNFADKIWISTKKASNFRKKAQHFRNIFAEDFLMRKTKWPYQHMPHVAHPCDSLPFFQVYRYQHKIAPNTCANVYVLMHICMCMCMCIYVSVSVCVYVCVCVRIRIYMYIYMLCINISVYVYIYIYIYIYIYTQIHTFMCIYTHTYIYKDICIYIYVCIYTYTYTYV